MKLIMDEDSTTANLYQEAYAQIKMNKEVDIDRINAVHDRFDYFKDPQMEKKIKDKRFDKKEADTDTSDECFTTDLSDLEADNVYRRYKLIHREAKEDHRMLEEKHSDFKKALLNQKILQRGDKAAQRPWRELEQELFHKKFR